MCCVQWVPVCKIRTNMHLIFRKPAQIPWQGRKRGRVWGNPDVW